MATEAQIKTWLSQSPRDWNQLCQALMYQLCKAFGSAPVVYSSAAAARDASTIVGTDPADAQPGDFHQFDIGAYDHVALSLGGSRCVMGSPHVAERWGINAGVTTVEAYCRATGARYLGFSRGNGRNDIAIEAPGLGPKQRQVKPGIKANRRGGPGVNFPEVGAELPAGTIGNFDAHQRGPINAQGTIGDWFRGISGNWFAALSFTDQGTHDLVDLNPVVVVPVEPEPDPPAEPEPPVVVPVPEPDVPGNPVEPAQPEEPSEPAQPVDPTPGNPEEPEQPEEPSEPAQPVDPTKPEPAETAPSPGAPVKVTWWQGLIVAALVAVAALWAWLTGGGQ